MGQWVVGFVGLALIYAAAATAVVLAGLKLVRDIPARRWIPLVFLTSFFVFLTQHPFPDRAALACPVPTAVPQLQPLHFWPAFGRLYETGASFGEWFGNRVVAATVMNLLVCAAIGAALARVARRRVVPFVFGPVLTLSVELSQLTGIWGLYPCAYRQFNVDDLMLNALGVIIGYFTARRFVRRPSEAAPGAARR